MSSFVPAPWGCRWLILFLGIPDIAQEPSWPIDSQVKLSFFCKDKPIHLWLRHTIRGQQALKTRELEEKEEQ